MWPAFNSFVVLLPCGKKGADGSDAVSKFGREETKKGGGTSISLYPFLFFFFFVCNFRFSKLSFSFKNDLRIFPRLNYFFNTWTGILYIFSTRGIFPCEILDLYNYFLSYLGIIVKRIIHCVLSFL